METNTVILFILFLYPGLALGENCDCYIRYHHKNSGEANIKFYKNVENDSIFSYVIGFTFRKPVDKLEVFGNRSSIRVNETLWFVTLQDWNKIDLVEFDFQIRHGSWNEVDRITFNGDTICQTVQLVSDHVSRISTNGSAIALSAINLIISACLVGLIVVLLLKISNLRTLTNEHWQQAINQVVDIQRRLSPLNPNNKGVPLPKVPPESSDSKRASYIDLVTYQRGNAKFAKKHNKILSRFTNAPPNSVKKNFKFFEGNPSRENEYVIQEANLQKQGTL